LIFLPAISSKHSSISSHLLSSAAIESSGKCQLGTAWQAATQPAAAHWCITTGARQLQRPNGELIKLAAAYKASMQLMRSCV
jgi:hypothetical protein